jgi:hypothetical protein
MKSTELSMATLYPTPMGYSSRRPKDWPAIDRRALMRDAHRIAKSFFSHFETYGKALAYGLRAAWMSAKSRQQIQSLNRQVGQPVARITTREIEASRRATRQCGSSLWAS